MQVFLSYAREDEAFASTLAQDLKSQRANIWIDLNDAPVDNKQQWLAAVEAALAESDILLVVMSQAAAQQSYIQNDWHFFMQHDRPVLVALSERCDIPPDLKHADTIDFSSSYESGLHRLQFRMIEYATRLAGSKWHRRPSHG
ncbi:MAG: toll/interleukin-1 receptor domain-containing protein [Chloroflexi bacterium]|nr:toll/interleukin-1 receptor domain-containing protein [Chloroflexota bacterium]